LGSTGYGLDDFGREKLEKVYAYCFGAEASLVRPNISSGTHVAYLVASSLDLAKKKVAFSPSEPYDSVFEILSTCCGSGLFGIQAMNQLMLMSCGYKGLEATDGTKG